MAVSLHQLWLQLLVALVAHGPADQVPVSAVDTDFAAR